MQWFKRTWKKDSVKYMSGLLQTGCLSHFNLEGFLFIIIPLFLQKSDRNFWYLNFLIAYNIFTTQNVFSSQSHCLNIQKYMFVPVMCFKTWHKLKIKRSLTYYLIDLNILATHFYKHKSVALD